MSDPSESIGFYVLGPLPAETGFGGSTSFDFGPVDIPPIPCDPAAGCGTIAVIDRYFGAPVSGTASLTDLSDFAGSGSNEFSLIVFPGRNQVNPFLYGTLTETITFAIPEPSTWAMMALGFAGVGFVGCYRAKRARVAV
jgi:hypothetical protein